jgi:hypothetical protein
MPKTGGTFTGDTGIVAASGAATLYAEGATHGQLQLKDTGAGANLKLFRILTDDGVTSFANYNDNGTWKNTPLTLNADGSATFGSRVYALGRFYSTGTYPGYQFNDTDAATDRKVAEFAYDGGTLGFHRYSDAAVYADTPFYMDSSGVFVMTYGGSSLGEFRSVGTITMQRATGGNVRLNSDGSATRTGWIEWRRASDARVAYMGYTLDSGNYVDLCFDVDGGYLNMVNGDVRLDNRAPAQRPTGLAGMLGYNSDADQGLVPLLGDGRQLVCAHEHGRRHLQQRRDGLLSLVFLPAGPFADWHGDDWLDRYVVFLVSRCHLDHLPSRDHDLQGHRVKSVLVQV